MCLLRLYDDFLKSFVNVSEMRSYEKSNHETTRERRCLLSERRGGRAVPVKRAGSRCDSKTHELLQAYWKVRVTLFAETQGSHAGPLQG